MFNLKFLVLSAAVLYANAQTVSLFLPFDPQPLSADVGGVDSQGRTTYIIQKGEIKSGDPADGFFGTATLVEGPSGASLTYAYPPASVTMGLECTFSAGSAICSGVDPESGSTVVETQSIELLAVQLGTTISPSATGAPSSVTTTASGGSSAPSSSRSNTSSGTSSGAKPTSSQPSSAVGQSPALALVVLGIVASFCAL